MHTREVPSEEWKPFLESFSRLRRGDAVDLEVMGGGAPPRSAVCDRPLVAIEAAADWGAGRCIEVFTGVDPLPAETHRIPRPAHLSVTETDDGVPMAVQITAEDGAVWLLRFEPSKQGTKPPGNYLG